MKQGDGEHPSSHYGQLMALLLYLTLWAADSFYWHFFPSLRAQIPLLVRMSLFLILTIFSFVLIKNASDMLVIAKKENRLLQEGLFRNFRHPVYLGILIFYFSLSILTLSVLSLLLLPFIFIYYDFLARYEEKYLYLKFGDLYLTYWEKTPRWGFKKRKILL